MKTEEALDALDSMPDPALGLVRSCSAFAIGLSSDTRSFIVAVNWLTASVSGPTGVARLPMTSAWCSIESVARWNGSQGVDHLVFGLLQWLGHDTPRGKDGANGTDDEVEHLRPHRRSVSSTLPTAPT